MPRKFAVSPVETLELEFPDGSIREAVFNVESLITLTEEFGDLGTLVEDEMTKPYELAAKILYAGMKSFNTETTLDEAKAIVVSGGIKLLAEIYDLFNQSFGDIEMDELKKNLTPAINKMIMNATKS